jgi:hypothetical protein
MLCRYLLILPILFPTSAVAQAGKTKVEEIAPRARISENRLVNPATTAPSPQLPAAALSKGKHTDDEEGKRAGWERAKWRLSSLHVAGTAQVTVQVASPSTLLIKAVWPASADNLTVSVLKGGKTLTSVKPTQRFDGYKTAIAHVKVASAGNITVKASGGGTKPVNMKLYIGTITANP